MGRARRAFVAVLAFALAGTGCGQLAGAHRSPALKRGGGPEPVSLQAAQDAFFVPTIRYTVARVTRTRWIAATTSADSIRSAVGAAFGPEAQHALAVLGCENPALDPSAIHHNLDGTSDWGLFQINIVYDRWAFDFPKHLLDADYNIEVAVRTYRALGWHDWTCGRRLGLG
jgi:hypothetical protein